MKLPDRSMLTDSSMAFYYSLDLHTIFNRDPWNLTKYLYETRFNFINNLITREYRHSHLKILDIGCGSGNHTLFYAGRGCDVVAVDITVSAMKYIKLKGEEKELANVALSRANAEFLPFKDNTFDLTILSEVLEHLPKPEVLIHEIKRILKPRGCAVITTPNGGKLHKKVPSYQDLRKLTEHSIRERRYKLKTHLFEFKKKELMSLIANENLYVKNSAFLLYGGQKIFKIILRWPIPVSLVRKAETFLLNMPLVGEKFAECMLIQVLKT